MGRTIDYSAAREELKTAFEAAEKDFRESRSPRVPRRIQRATGALFASKEGLIKLRVP